MKHLKIIKLSSIGIIYLLISLLTSCSSKPKFPESFGVYYLSSNDYIEIERKEVWDRKQSLGKPTAGELGIRNMSKVFSDPRFGKDHTIRRYYISMSEAPFISIDEFIKNGLIINGESITNCELIKVPDKVKDINDNYHDNYTGTIYYKIIDSWGELNYTANYKIPVKQKLIEENLYQIMPNEDIKTGIYLLNYKSHGQSLSNEFLPFYITTSDNLNKLESAKLLDSEKIKDFIINGSTEYINKNGFYYHVNKNGSGSAMNKMKKITAEYTLSFLDSIQIYSTQCTFTRYTDGNDTIIFTSIPYLNFSDHFKFPKLIGQFKLGTQVDIIIPSEILKYNSTGYRRSSYEKGLTKYPIDIPPYTSLLLELKIDK